MNPELEADPMTATTTFPSPPMAGRQQYNACTSSASNSGEEGDLPTLALCYEKAKSIAELSFCLLKADLGNQRLLLRYVRALRRCEWFKSSLLAYVAPSPSLSPQPEPEPPDA